MNIRRILLGASVAANVVLLALAIASARSWPETPATAVRPDDRSSTAPDTHGRESLPRVASSSPLLWSALATPDPAVLLQRLLAAGLPRHIASAIINDQMAAETEALYVELWGEESKLPYWRSRDQHYYPSIRARLFRHHADRHAVEHELLLRPTLDDEHARRFLAREFGVSDPEKQKALTEINSDYLGVSMTSIANAGPDLRQAARQTASMVREEKELDIAALLTPAEYQAYQLRQSDVASRLRSTLGKYCATEEEYRALYAACAALKPPAPPESRPSKTLTTDQLLEQARKVLPPDRYAEVEQAFAPGAERINRLAGRLGLPLVAVKPVHIAQQELKARAATVRSDPTLRSLERSAQLAAIAREATQRITATLGERGFAAYHEYDGSWITELTAPPPAASPPP